MHSSWLSDTSNHAIFVIIMMLTLMIQFLSSIAFIISTDYVYRTDNGRFIPLVVLVLFSFICVHLVIVGVFSMQVEVKVIVLMSTPTLTQTDNVCVAEEVIVHALHCSGTSIIIMNTSHGLHISVVA